MREITEGLKPIKEGIENIPQAITFPTYLSIQVAEKPPEGEYTENFGPLAREYLGKYTTKDEPDTTYGLYFRRGKLYIGNRLAIIVDNDIIFGKDEYEGTHGLWELIVSKEPDDSIYTINDLLNYAKLMVKTNALRRNNNPESCYPKTNRKIYLKTFGIIGKSMREVGLWLFRAILRRC